MARRVESKTSSTAEFTCMARALSYTEKREYLKSDDYISSVILNDIVKLMIKIPPIKSRLISHYPDGMYEYVVARTKYFDGEFKEALQDGTEQVLIFGAGFDSRGIRFHELSKGAMIFELDAPVTQTAKINRYKEKGINIPENLVFIPIDFDRQSLPERLVESGFKKGRKTLFLLEGLTMYLKPRSVDETFRLIQEFADPNSRVVFDHIYSSVLRRDNLYKGEKEMVRSVSGRKESFQFGIEKGSIDEFLSRYGFEALRVMDSDALEDMFFRDKEGRPAAKVSGTHCIVTTVVKGR